MAEKKTAAKGYQKFKADLAAGTLGEVYIFCGEESYLREYYLKEVQKKLVPAGFEEFNFHRVAGKGLTMEELTEMTEAMPMMMPSMVSTDRSARSSGRGSSPCWTIFRNTAA